MVRAISERWLLGGAAVIYLQAHQQEFANEEAIVARHWDNSSNNTKENNANKTVSCGYAHCQRLVVPVIDGWSDNDEALLF
jgi:hypothetical protein